MNINVKLNSETGFSIPDLVARSRSTVKSATRDIEFLTAYGVTPGYLANLESKTNLLDNFLQFKEQQADKKQVTGKRDKKAKKFKISTKRLIAQLEFVYSPETEDYDTIFSTKLAKITPKGLMELGGNILYVLSKPNENLALYGVTTERIAEFEAEWNELKALYEEQVYETSSFSIQTQKRNELKSEVYKLLRFVSRIGKTYWTIANKGYYNNYVLHKTKSPPNTAQTELTGSVQTPEGVEILASNF